MEQDINQMAASSGKVLDKNSEVKYWGDSITEHGIHTTITELRALNEGRSFCATYIAETLASDGILTTHIKTGEKEIDIKFENESGYAVRCALYSGATITADGTEFLTFNKNLGSDRVKTASVYHTPTITDAGTKIGERQNGESERRSSGAMVAGYSGSIVVPPNTSVIYTVQNKGDVAAVVSTTMEWLEEV